MHKLQRSSLSHTIVMVLTVILFATLVFSVNAQGGFYNEAPMLAEQVAAGELPPVDDRMPIVPVVLQPEEIGQYGGTWHMALLGTRDRAMLRRTMWYEGLVRWDPQWLRVVPNVAESFVVNEDSTVYTFKLRQGMRWSDGAPLTADDIMFWYNDILLNTELALAMPWWMSSGDGSAAVVEKIDDLTFAFHFSQPNGLFLQNLAHPEATEPVSFPKHYLSQFHASYNADGLEALIAAEGIEPAEGDNAPLWVHLMGRKSMGSNRYANTELPTVNPWVLTEGYTSDAVRVQAIRNPYYWKVDTNFSQLPYIDSIDFVVKETVDEIIDLALAGEIDMQQRHIATIENQAVLEENRAQGGYEFFNAVPESANSTVIMFNLTHPDPAMNEMFNQKNFRAALSLGINREQIVDEVYLGQGTPYQVAPSPQSIFYNETLATQFTEYNVEQANQMLDELGYAERNADGIRLRPDGTPIAFTITISDNDPSNSSWGRVMELVAGYWQALGVDAVVEIMERDAAQSRVDLNQHDVYIWEGMGGLEVILNPVYYVPMSPGASFYAIGWSHWYTNRDNAAAIEPPAPVQEQLMIYRQLLSTADTDTQNMLMQKLLTIATDQFYTIGVSLPGNSFGIVRTNFRNVPSVMPLAWSYPSPAPTNPEQYFIVG